MKRKVPRVHTSEALIKATGHRERYGPRGVARDLFTDRSDEILLAGPAGTGKSLACLHKVHLVLSKYPNARGLMARKTRTSMTNSCLATYQNLVLKPIDKVHFHKQDQQFNYPNGSVLAVMGLDDPERVKSTEFDIAFIQEATECTENDIEITTTRLRNWKVPYQQLIMDCNPDKPSHWLKKRCDKGQSEMLLSLHRDNPKLWHGYENGVWYEEWTPQGDSYIAKLQRLSGARRARLYAGQWVAAEGVVYEDWDAQVHMISRHEMPEHWDEWPHYWAIDWGYIHPFVWQDWVENPETGTLYLNRQIYRTKYLVEDASKDIMALCMAEKLPVPQAIICDHDAGDRAVLEKHTGLLTLPAYKIIQPGIQAVKKRLKHDWGPYGTGIRILRDSLVDVDQDLQEEGKPTKTEDEFDGYVWDEKHNKDANSKRDELPVDKDNHGVDPTRYIVAFIDSLADDPEDVDGILTWDEEVHISPY